MPDFITYLYPVICENMRFWIYYDRQVLGVYARILCEKGKAEDDGSVTSFVNFFYFNGQFRFIPEHQVIKVPVRSIA
jgi:hypothetical protein